MRHVISVLLQNELGALTRMTGLFSSRGYNIDSLNVAPTDDPTASRVTIVISGSDGAISESPGVLQALTAKFTFCGMSPVYMEISNVPINWKAFFIYPSFPI